MKVWSDSFNNGDAIPARCALGKHDPDSHVAFAENKSPHLAWSDAPDGTKSFAVICVDTDCPSAPDNVNKEGVTVPHDLPRVDFYHWGVCDLASTTSSLAEGAFSEGVTAKGKDGPSGPENTRSATNNYTQWFEGDESMAGQYFGYDGPCPPWNDERVHHYHFTVYALDVASLDVDGTFDCDALKKAAESHALAQATVTGSYHIYSGAK